MKKYLIAALALAALMTSCNSNTWDVTSDLSVDKVDPTQGLTPLAQDPGMDYAPLYWSVYGALRQQEKDGSFPNIFTEKDWDEAIDFVATKLKPLRLRYACHRWLRCYGWGRRIYDALQPLSEG